MDFLEQHTTATSSPLLHSELSERHLCSLPSSPELPSNQVPSAKSSASLHHRLERLAKPLVGLSNLQLLNLQLLKLSAAQVNPSRLASIKDVTPLKALLLWIRVSPPLFFTIQATPASPDSLSHETPTLHLTLPFSEASTSSLHEFSDYYPSPASLPLPTQ